MSRYDYDKKLHHKKFEVQIDSKAKYGYFEHDYYGDELGGGLWFNDENELIDYDGVFDLPEEVREAIEMLGFSTEEV